MPSSAPTLLKPIERVGALTVQTVGGFGDFCIFCLRTFVQLSIGWWRWKNWRLLAPQFFDVGVRSLPVVVVTGGFIGLVLAVLSYPQFASAGLSDRMGVLVNVPILKELGPILAAVMVAGRVGGALTAELGTMRVTEQIDAVRAMGTDPIRLLVCPRFLACVMLTPLLTVYADLMGVAGGWVISVFTYGVDNTAYWDYSARAVTTWVIMTGVVKSFFFGGAIALLSCYKGFNCRPGAEGVGRATTEAFVTSFLAILVLDFFLAVFLQALDIRLHGFQQVL